MPDEYQDLGRLLNESTPLSASSPEEVEERLAAARKRQEEEVGAADEEKGIAFVYVTTRRDPDPGTPPEYELRSLADGSAGLSVFTDLDLLLERFGAAQTWARVPVLELLLLVAKEKVGVVLNPVLAPDVPIRSAPAS